MKLKQRLHKLACRAYAWAEKHWFAKLVYVDSPMVKAMDAMMGSKCKYCMAARALMFGLGLGLAVSGGFAALIGLILIVAAFLLTQAESNFCTEE